jgi:hypothetical protein
LPAKPSVRLPRLACVHACLFKAGSRESCKSALSLPHRLLFVPIWHSFAEVEQNRNIPPRYAVRLDDLRAWHVVFAACAACGKRARVDARLLRQGRPPYTRLLDLERKLYCGSCGNRQGNTLSVSLAPRN